MLTSDGHSGLTALRQAVGLAAGLFTANTTHGVPGSHPCQGACFSVTSSGLRDEGSDRRHPGEARADMKQPAPAGRPDGKCRQTLLKAMVSP
jgi:hypothetical protein